MLSLSKVLNRSLKSVLISSPGTKLNISHHSGRLVNQKFKQVFRQDKTNFSTSLRQCQKKFRSKVIKKIRPSQNVNYQPITAGQVAVGAGSLLGLGSLCYYGLGVSNSSKTSLLDESLVWPAYVRQRIRDVYFYFGSSIASTAVAAFVISKNPQLLRMVSGTGWMSFFGVFAALIASSMLVNSIEYRPGFGAKQIALLIHTGVLGAIIAPLCVIGGPAIIRAAAYTAGCCGSLSAIAFCAPSDKFLTWGGPLAAGLGVVFLASIGSAFLPPTPGSMAGMTLYSIAMYGGLLLFSLYLLHDTQRIIYNAKANPRGARFDPVSQSMSIYMDTINIFIRLAAMMAGGNRGK